jgi:2-polyprenyl-6-methoxyphenol hydroxylase-like FAD-dependent oxidoreductase
VQVLPPDRLIVLGDAYCNFNPIYAQGITVAAIQARLLGQLLAQRIIAASHTDANNSTSGANTGSVAAAQRADVAAAVAGLNAEFYPAAAEVVGAAWSFAAGRDMLYPFAGLQGEKRSIGWRLMQSYVGAIFRVAAVDSEVRLPALRAV